MGFSILYLSSVSLEYGKYIKFIFMLQLFGSSMVIYFLDQILRIYGICSSLSLLFAANTCKTIFWQAFSPVTISSTIQGIQFEGSIVCFVHYMLTWNNKLYGLYESLFRKNLPNLTTIFSTILIFITMIYLQGMSGI